MIRVFFDTETTGLPARFGAPAEDLASWTPARLVQLSWIVDRDGEQIGYGDLVVRPDGFVIPDAAVRVHGITTEAALAKGVDCKLAVYSFLGIARLATELVGHNVEFDMGVVGSGLVRHWGRNWLGGMKTRDTMKESAAPGAKWPKLTELHARLFGEEFADAHDSLADVAATRRCFWELVKRGEL